MNLVQVPIWPVKLLNFSKKKIESHDENMYLADPFLIRCLERLITKDVYERDVHPDLSKFGHRVTSEIWDLGRKCELEPPYLAGHTNAWGKPLKNQDPLKI